MVLGTCGAGEDGHTVEVLAQAISTNSIVATNLTKTTTCTEAGSSATWTTTFTRDNLNSLRTNNMRASFSASVTNDAGLTGEASPKALFVVPDIEPIDISSLFAIMFEDIYQIGDTCQLVLAVNFRPTGPFTFYFRDIKDDYIFGVSARNSGSVFSVTEYPSLVNFYSAKSFRPARLSSLRDEFITTFFLTIPKENNAMHMFNAAWSSRVDSQTYHHCGVGPSAK